MKAVVPGLELIWILEIRDLNYMANRVIEEAIKREYPSHICQFLTTDQFLHCGKIKI